MPARPAPIVFSERALTNGRLETFYSERFDPPLLVVQPGLSAEERRVREMEAQGYRTGASSLPYGCGRFFMYAYETASEVPAETVAAIRSVVAEMEPSWWRRSRRRSATPIVRVSWPRGARSCASGTGRGCDQGSPPPKQLSRQSRKLRAGVCLGWPRPLPMGG